MTPRFAYLRRARHWIANRGWRGFLSQIFYRLQLLVAGQPLPGKQTGEAKPHPFDLAYQVDTAGLVWGESLDDARAGADARYWVTGYYGIAPSAFRAAVERLSLDWRRFTFVDIGCGKGRALLLALRFPFRQVLGVELSGALAATAQANLRTFAASWQSPATPAEVIAGDATLFPLPDGPLLLFLYHPFAAPVMKRFLAHVHAAARASTRDIIVLYANPELDGLLTGSSGIRRLWKDAFPLCAEDKAADRFESSYEYFAAYEVES